MIGDLVLTLLLDIVPMYWHSSQIERNHKVVLKL